MDIDYSFVLQAEKLARKMHKGQKRWNGKPYICHPRAVADACTSNLAKAAGWLHDVLEDKFTDFEIGVCYLREQGFPEEVVRLVRMLSRQEGERYVDFIVCVASDTVATEVKIADLNHNLSTLTDKRDKQRKEKYELALQLLRDISR